MATLRVVHYLNQFFAGVGGEDKADVPPRLKEGALGPAQALQGVLQAQREGQVVATVFCGDNYITERREEAITEIIELVRALKPDVLVAGPAFASGRYGLACGAVGAAVKNALEIPAVAGMHRDNPGAEEYRSSIYIAPTSDRATGMSDALAAIARLAIKLGKGEELSAADEEGYIPTGRVRNEFSDRTMATRLVDMLLKKIKGETFQTEWPLPKHEVVSPAAALASMPNARIALVTEGGVVPRGNPDRLPGGWAEKWVRYEIKDTSDLTPGQWQSVHGGFDTRQVNQDPDRVAPVDALRDLEKEKAFAKLHDYMYVTVGNLGYVRNMKRFGKEIAQELLEAGVDGVILTGT